MSRLRMRNQRNGQAGVHDVKVLLYHRIVRDSESAYGDRWAVGASLFREHLRFVDRWGFTAITFEDYALSLAGELNLPRKPIVITFDDGYAETHELAFPILQEFGMKAVVYVLGDRNVRTNVWDRDNGWEILQLMTYQQILELQGAGFEIGSHSLTHQNLITLNDREAWEEISRSKKLLETSLNSPVRTFSYPYGFLNERAKSMVVDAGYQFACAAWSGPARFSDDPFEIRRIVIPRNLSVPGLAMRLLPTYSYYRWSWWQLRQLFNVQDRISSRHKHTHHHRGGK